MSREEKCKEIDYFSPTKRTLHFECRPSATHLKRGGEPHGQHQEKMRPLKAQADAFQGDNRTKTIFNMMMLSC